MPLDEERLRRLSPGALRIFKQQLPQRLKEMGELERNTTLEQLRSVPDIWGEAETAPQPTEKEGMSWWQYPLKWMENISTGAGTLLAAPFTPAVKGTEGLSWWEREQAEYEAWEEPGFQVEPLFRFPWTPQEIRDKEWTIGVKGVLETVPWIATAIGTGGVAGLGYLGAKTGISALTRVASIGGRALKPFKFVEAVATMPAQAAIKVAGKVVGPIIKPVLAPVSKQVSKLAPLMEPVGKAIAKAEAYIPEAARFTAPTVDTMLAQITKMDWQRKVAQMFGRNPVLKSIVERIGGRAATVTEVIEDSAARAILVAARTQERLLAKGQVALATIGRIHQNPIRLFGVDEATGLVKKVKVKPKYQGASLHISDIAEHPNKYILSAEQSEYIKQIHNIEDWVLDGLKQAGVDVRQLKFDDFSHWVHREVIGKNIDDALTKVRKGGGRIGAKAGWEKTRFYETAAEGVEAGIIYEPSLERVVELYIQSASKRIADQRIAEMLAPLGETALQRAWGLAPEVMKEAITTTKQLAGAKQLVKVLQRASRGEKLPVGTLSAQERRFPELGAKLRELMEKPVDDIKAAVKPLLDEAKATVEQATTPYWKGKAARAGVMERAKTPTLGTESTIFHPAFQGKIYPKHVADEVYKYWNDRGWGPLNNLATISGEMRTLVAAADFSAPFIQGLPAIGRYPMGWAKNVVEMFKSFKNPKNYDNFIAKNYSDFMEFGHHGGYVGGFEFMESMPALQAAAGRVTGLAGKAQAGRSAVRQTYGRFEAGFGQFGDGMRLHIWNALKGRAKNAEELAEIARHVNRMTGVMSQKELGIGAGQRSFEQAFGFFAPRYTRAGFALIGDLLKGGITGAETRKALGSMMAAGAMAYTGFSLALGQEPNFDPTNGRFMTVEITDPLTGTTRHFGIGGMMTSLIRFGADVSASLVRAGENEPLDLVKLNRFDNPFMKFMFSKSAPLTGFIEGLAFGHNYFGEPFENPSDYALFLGEQVMPIAAQAAFMEEAGLSPTAILGEEMGARTFPQSDWEKRNDARDEAAQAQFGMSWDEVGQKIGKYSQLILEQENPRLQELTQRAQETSSRMARGEGKIWDMWRKEGKAIEETYREGVTLAAREFETLRDGTTLREKVNEAATIRRAMYAQREQDPQFNIIQDYFNEPLEASVIAKMNKNDLARREYYQLMYAPDMYDQFGNYMFDEADRREKYFVQKYGKAALDYIEAYMGAKWEEPPVLQVLKEARKLLEPYWEIENRVWAQQPPQLKQIADQITYMERMYPDRAKEILKMYPQIVAIRKWIADYRKQMRLANIEIDRALRTFYRR